MSAVLPKKSIIAKFWIKAKSNCLIINDIGVCMCMACGNDGGTGGRDWDKARYLERCHIVPRELGGSDSVENLILLCKGCHKEAPDTNFKRHFLTWCRTRENHVLLFSERMAAAFKSLEMDYDLEDRMKLISMDFIKFRNNNVGTHTTKHYMKDYINTAACYKEYKKINSIQYVDFY